MNNFTKIFLFCLAVSLIGIGYHYYDEINKAEQYRPRQKIFNPYMETASGQTDAEYKDFEKNSV